MKRTKRLTRIVLVIAIALVIVLGVSSVSYAATPPIWAGGYYSMLMAVNTSSVSSSYSTAMTNAQNAWNNAAAGYLVMTVNSYGNAVWTAYMTDRIYGLYQPVIQSQAYYPHVTTSFRLWVNRTYCDSLSTNGKTNVILHELGHGMGLLDRSSGASVMNTSVQPGAYTVPQTEDKYWVRYLWQNY
jgi:hypothetical protein